MRGRKPAATAVRRGEDAAMLAPVVKANAEIIQEQGCQKPVAVANNQRLSDMWDLAVGTGAAFEPQDVPFITQFVTDMVLVEECQRHMFREDGTPQPMVTTVDDEGNLDIAPNPYSKVMRDTMAEALKLADELGLTRFARTRLGLAQAAGQAITVSIADQIDRAIARRGK